MGELTSTGAKIWLMFCCGVEWGVFVGAAGATRYILTSSSENLRRGAQGVNFEVRVSNGNSLPNGSGCFVPCRETASEW